MLIELQVPSLWGNPVFSVQAKFKVVYTGVEPMSKVYPSSDTKSFRPQHTTVAGVPATST